MAEWRTNHQRDHYFTQWSAIYFVNILSPATNCDPSSHDKWNPAIPRSYCPIQNFVQDTFIPVPRLWCTNARRIFYFWNQDQQAILRYRLQFQHLPISEVSDSFSILDSTTLIPRSICALHMSSRHKSSYKDPENLGYFLLERYHILCWHQSHCDNCGFSFDFETQSIRKRTKVNGYRVCVSLFFPNAFLANFTLGSSAWECILRVIVKSRCLQKKENWTLQHEAVWYFGTF